MRRLPVFSFCGTPCLLLLWDSLSSPSVGLPVFSFCGTPCLLLLWDSLSSPYVGLPVFSFCGTPCLLLLWDSVFSFCGTPCLLLLWDSLSTTFTPSQSIRWFSVVCEGGLVGGGLRLFLSAPCVLFFWCILHIFLVFIQYDLKQFPSLM